MVEEKKKKRVKPSPDSEEWRKWPYWDEYAAIEDRQVIAGPAAQIKAGMEYFNNKMHAEAVVRLGESK